MCTILHCHSREEQHLGGGRLAVEPAVERRQKPRLQRWVKAGVIDLRDEGLSVCDGGTSAVELER